MVPGIILARIYLHRLFIFPFILYVVDLLIFALRQHCELRDQMDQMNQMFPKYWHCHMGGGVFPLPEHFWRNAFNPSLPPQWWAITPKLIIWHCQHFGNIWSSNSYLLVDNFFFGKQGTNMLMIKAKTILINVTNILINVTNTLMVVWLILPGVIFDWRDRGWAPLGNFGSCLGWWTGRKTETKQNATNEINEIWYWTDQKCLFLQFFYLSFASFFSPPPKYSTGWES